MLLLMLCSCGAERDVIDASQNGVLPENTGKDNSGASGFGIGFGYAEEESNYLTGCEGYDLLLEGEHIDRLMPVIEGCQFEKKTSK